MSYTVIAQGKNPELLRKCVASIKSEYNPEIIVVSVGFFTELSTINEIKDIKGIQISEDKSYGAGMNLGMREASYENVIFVQDDVIVEPYVFDRLFEYYKTNDYVILSPNILEHKGCDNEISDKIIPVDYSIRNALGRVCACFVINKKYYDILGGMDEQFFPLYYDDMDLFYRMTLLNIFRIGWVCNIIVHHQGKSTINLISNFGELIELNRIRYMAKWGGESGKETFTKPYNRD